VGYSCGKYSKVPSGIADKKRMIREKGAFLATAFLFINVMAGQGHRSYGNGWKFPYRDFSSVTAGELRLE
jgi:hypothetical protein